LSEVYVVGVSSKNYGKKLESTIYTVAAAEANIVKRVRLKILLMVSILFCPPC